jgi:hypothetical protein
VLLKAHHIHAAIPRGMSASICERKSFPKV